MNTIATVVAAKKKSLARMVSVGFMGLCTIGVSGTAYASQFYGAPGFMCVPDDWADASVGTLGLANTSNSQMQVLCPIAQENGGGLGIGEIFIRVRDLSDNAGVSCRVRNCDGWGVNCVDGPSVTSSVGGTGDYTLNLSDTSLLSSPSYGFSYIRCHLPAMGSMGASSRIVGYRWTDY